MSGLLAVVDRRQRSPFERTSAKSKSLLTLEELTRSFAEVERTETSALLAGIGGGDSAPPTAWAASSVLDGCDLVVAQVWSRPTPATAPFEPRRAGKTDCGRGSAARGTAGRATVKGPRCHTSAGCRMASVISAGPTPRFPAARIGPCANRARNTRKRWFTTGNIRNGIQPLTCDFLERTTGFEPATLTLAR